MGAVPEGGGGPTARWRFYFPIRGDFELNFSGSISGFHFCSDMPLNPERKYPDKTKVKLRFISPTHAVIFCPLCHTRLVVHYNSDVAPIRVAYELRVLEDQEKAKVKVLA